MGILQKAAADVEQLLLSVGIEPMVACHIGQAAYLNGRNRTMDCPEPVRKKSEVAWIAQQVAELARQNQAIVELSYISFSAYRLIFGDEAAFKLELSFQPEDEEGEPMQGQVRDSTEDQAKHGNIELLKEHYSAFQGITRDVLSATYQYDENFDVVEGHTLSTDFEVGRSEAIREQLDLWISLGETCQAHFVDHPRNGGDPDAVDPCAMPCYLLNTNGSVTEGLLFQNNETVSFFTTYDFAGIPFGLSAPLDLRIDSVLSLACFMDEGFIDEYGSSWDNIMTVESDEMFGINFIYATGESYHLIFSREMIAANEYGTAFINAISFFDVLDQRIFPRYGKCDPVKFIINVK